MQPFIATGDSELTVILSVGFGVFVAGFAHYAGASDAVGALLAGWSSPAPGSARASRGC